MFIVLDGIDGAGKGRQRYELVNYLTDRNLQVSTTDFPDHEGQIYKDIIHPALHEEFDMTPHSWFLAFVLDHLLWSSRISPTIKSKKKHFVSDGYFTTTLAYQSKLQKVLTLEESLQFAKRFKMPVPDVVIFLDVDPEVAMQRKLEEEGHDEGLDIFERSLKKQQQIRKAFLDLAKGQVWTKWFIVDGNQTIEEVAISIKKVLLDNRFI